MNPIIDRIEKELKLDMENEERMKQLFSPDILSSRSYLLNRLHRLEAIYARYKYTTRTDEQITLQLLLVKKKGLEKFLYPNSVSRALRSFWGRFKTERKVKSSVNDDTETGMRLQETAKSMGFFIDGKIIQKHLENSLDQFLVTSSFYMSATDRMEYNLQFARDEHGFFQFEKFLAVIKEEKSGNLQKQTFSITEDNITAVKAYNLLAGRTVLQECIDDGGNIERSWIKLDFNDKDANGNHKVKRFLSNYGFDLEKSLEILNPKELNSPKSKELLIACLKNGERKEVSIDIGGEVKKVFIEVNAQMRSFNFLDKDNNQQRPDAIPKSTVVNSIEINKDRESTTKRKRGISIN